MFILHTAGHRSEHVMDIPKNVKYWAQLIVGVLMIAGIGYYVVTTAGNSSDTRYDPRVETRDCTYFGGRDVYLGSDC